MNKRFNTLFIGQNIRHFDALDSTNNYTIELIRQNDIVEGTVVTAKYQTEGKGQRNKYWESEKGKNLLCTIAIKPNFLDVKQLFYISKISALAVTKTLNSFGIGEIAVKWPNDVLAGGFKVAGILIESFLKNHKVEWVTVGLGLNINQLEFPKFNIPAISMKLCTGRNFCVEEVTERFLLNFEVYYLLLRNKNFDKIDNFYQQRLYLKDEKIQFELQGQQKLLTIRKVDEIGRLICEDEEGQFIPYEMHQLSLSEQLN